MDNSEYLANEVVNAVLELVTIQSSDLPDDSKANQQVLTKQQLTLALIKLIDDRIDQAINSGRVRLRY